MNRGLKEKLAWTEPDAELERLDALAARLAEADGPADDGLEWPDDLWSLLEQAGATRWSLSEEFGGNRLSAAAPGSAIRPTGRRQPHGRLHPVAARRGRPPAAGRARK